MGIIVNTAECAAQLMIDTLIVERVHKETEDAGRGQSLAMAAKTAGTVVATILSLVLMLVLIVEILNSFVGQFPYSHDCYFSDCRLFLPRSRTRRPWN